MAARTTCPFSAQINFLQQERNFTSGNTRRRYPQAQELLTPMLAAARLRGVGVARPATVEA